MAPTLTCIRHAQGYHNLAGDNDEKLHDPDLTQRGREQCERLSKNFPYQDEIDLILVSPIRRTIQTALIGLAPAIKERGLKVRLAPRAQETSSKPSDTGSDGSELQKEFGDVLDMRRMDEKWNSNEGEWAMDSESVEQHVVEIRRAIKKLDFKHVALVAHGGFMHYFTEDWTDCPDGEGSTGWANTEFRTYNFISGDGAHLKETPESRDRRSDEPAGGFVAANGAPDV